MPMMLRSTISSSLAQFGGPSFKLVVVALSLIVVLYHTSTLIFGSWSKDFTKVELLISDTDSGNYYDVNSTLEMVPVEEIYERGEDGDESSSSGQEDVGSVLLVSENTFVGWYCHKTIPAANIRLQLSIFPSSESSSEKRTTTTRKKRKVWSRSFKLNKYQAKFQNLTFCRGKTVNEFRHSYDRQTDAALAALISASVGEELSFNVTVSSTRNLQAGSWSFPSYGGSTLLQKLVGGDRHESRKRRNYPPYEAEVLARRRHRMFLKVQQHQLLLENNNVTSGSTASSDQDDSSNNYVDSDDESVMVALGGPADKNQQHSESRSYCELKYYRDSSGSRKKDQEVPAERAMLINRTLKEFKRNPDWPFSRRIVCGGDKKGVAEISQKERRKDGQEGKKEKKQKKKGRALVMYMIHSTIDKVPESQNLEYFIDTGYIGNGTTTALFDGVDYVLYHRTKRHPNISSSNSSSSENGYRPPDYEPVRLVAQIAGNVRLLAIPWSCRCDLCAHGMVLSYLQFQERSQFHRWPYRSVIFANSGVRGPFLSASELQEQFRGGAGASSSAEHSSSSLPTTTWVDIVSVGEGKRPATMKGDLDEAFATVTGVAFNSLILAKVPHSTHLQSFFLVVPITTLPFFYRLFTEGACWTLLNPSPLDFAYKDFGGKKMCILAAEVRGFDLVDPKRNGLGSSIPLEKIRMYSTSTRALLDHSIVASFEKDNDAPAVASHKKGVTGGKDLARKEVAVAEAKEKQFNENATLKSGEQDIHATLFRKFGGHHYRWIANSEKTMVEMLTKFSVDVALKTTSARRKERSNKRGGNKIEGKIRSDIPDELVWMLFSRQSPFWANGRQ